jgi:hypothetical protein
LLNPQKNVLNGGQRKGICPFHEEQGVLDPRYENAKHMSDVMVRDVLV